MLFKKKKRDEEENIRCCALCEKARDCGEYMECKIKGRVEKDHSCRKYSYDITKRVPRRALEMPKIEI